MNIKFVGLSSISPNVGLELWLSYLEYICRNNIDPIKIDKLFSQAIQQIGVENDSSCKLSRWHARLLAKRGDMLSARKIWNGIMGHQANKGEKIIVTTTFITFCYNLIENYFSASAVLWLEYSNVERHYGEPHQLRTLFKRALSTNTDWPQCIAEEWLMFEREYGSLEDVLKCEEKTKRILKTQMQARPQPLHKHLRETKVEEELKSDHRQKRRRLLDEDDREKRFKKGLTIILYLLLECTSKSLKNSAFHNSRKQYKKIDNDVLLQKDSN